MRSPKVGGWEPISARKYSRLELTKRRLGEAKCSTGLAAHLEKMVVSCQRSRKMSLPFCGVVACSKEERVSIEERWRAHRLESGELAKSRKM